MTHAGRAAARGERDRRALAELLHDRARWVRRRLTAGREHGVEPGEETLTEDLLLDMSLALPALRVRAFTRAQESVNGADWEFWVQGQRWWFGMRVQAKRLYVPSGGGRPRYDVDKKIKRSDGTEELQVDAFWREAVNDRIPALYALYNGPDLMDPPVPWNCKSHLPAAGALGVAFVPARTVQRLQHSGIAGRSGLAMLAPHALPWSCYAECPRGWPDPRALPPGRRPRLASDGQWQQAVADGGLAVRLAATVVASFARDAAWSRAETRQVAPAHLAAQADEQVGPDEPAVEPTPLPEASLEVEDAEGPPLRTVGLHEDDEVPVYVRRILAGLDVEELLPPVSYVAVLGAGPDGRN